MPFKKKEPILPELPSMESQSMDINQVSQIQILNQNNEILRQENQKLTQDRKELLDYLEVIKDRKELSQIENFNYHLIINLQKINKSLTNIDLGISDLVKLEASKQGLEVQ